MFPINISLEHPRPAFHLLLPEGELIFSVGHGLELWTVLYSPRKELEIPDRPHHGRHHCHVEVPAIAGLRGPGSMARSPPGRTG